MTPFHAGLLAARLVLQAQLEVGPGDDRWRARIDVGVIETPPSQTWSRPKVGPAANRSRLARRDHVPSHEDTRRVEQETRIGSAPIEPGVPAQSGRHRLACPDLGLEL